MILALHDRVVEDTEGENGIVVVGNQQTLSLVCVVDADVFFQEHAHQVPDLLIWEHTSLQHSKVIKSNAVFATHPVDIHTYICICFSFSALTSQKPMN